MLIKSGFGEKYEMILSVDWAASVTSRWRSALGERGHGAGRRSSGTGDVERSDNDGNNLIY